ncbi:MAG TPA: hypothetical protein VFE62_09680 [Gemmataceae bacterium]|nr:hypothetical protein [Gemmataceae bacterium]
MGIAILIGFIAFVIVFWAVVWPLLRWHDKHNAEKDDEAAKAAQIAAAEDLLEEVECAEGGEEAWRRLKEAGMSLLEVLDRRSITLTFNLSSVCLAKKRRDL